MSDADGSDAPNDEEGEDPVRDVVRVDGDEPDDDSADGDEELPAGDGVMDPDDLDIRERDGVDETDDGRYVISTKAEQRESGSSNTTTRGQDPDGPAHERVENDDTDVDSPAVIGAGSDSDGTPSDTGEVAGSANAGDPLNAVAAELDALSSTHGFALAVAASGETDTLRVASGDPTDTLETALRWYARRINPNVPADETVAELLAASDIEIE